MSALRKNPLSVVSAPVIYSKKKKGKGKNRLTGDVFSILFSLWKLFCTQVTDVFSRFFLCFQKVAINKAVQTLSWGNSFFPPASSFSSHSTLYLMAARRVFDAFDALKYKYSEERKPVKQLQVLP